VCVGQIVRAPVGGAPVVVVVGAAVVVVVVVVVVVAAVVVVVVAAAVVVVVAGGDVVVVVVPPPPLVVVVVAGEDVGGPVVVVFGLPGTTSAMARSAASSTPITPTSAVWLSPPVDRSVFGYQGVSTDAIFGRPDYVGSTSAAKRPGKVEPEGEHTAVGGDHRISSVGPRN